VRQTAVISRRLQSILSVMGGQNSAARRGSIGGPRCRPKKTTASPPARLSKLLTILVSKLGKLTNGQSDGPVRQ
jgi:hypothetical protein